MTQRPTSRRRLDMLATPVRWVGLGTRALLGPPARAVRGTARLVRDPARQVVDYWASERVTMRQGFVAVCIAALTSLAAGLVLVGMSHRIEAVAGLFVLIPASIGMRGNIFGALAARLGTSIHSGLFEVSRNKTSLLFQNVQAAILLTISTSVAMGALARAMASLLGLDAVSLWDFITVALLGGLLSSVVVLAVTVVVSIASYRRGWDLDAVGAPLITAIGDVVTLPSILAASYLVGIDVVTPVIGVLSAVAGVVAFVLGWRSGLAVARRVVRESFPVLCIAIVLNVLAGTVVEHRTEEVFLPLPALLIILPGFLENTGALGSILAARLGSKLHLGAISPSARPVFHDRSREDVENDRDAQHRTEEVFLPLPALLIILPGFLENTGALGSILAARLGSKLHLGAISPSARPEAAALLDFTIVLVLGITVFAITGAATLGIAELLGQAYPGVWRFMAAVMFGGTLATLVASLIGYYAAIFAHRFGFDPDNQTIPLVTSGMDLLGVICLIVALVIFGVA